MNQLKEGSQAPNFSALDASGKEYTLQSFKGKKLVLYFYPKDNTPGCTAEACNLRDNYTDLRMKGFEVIGVSPDSATSHQKFTDKFELPFILLSDPEKKMLQDYNAWGEKKMYGRSYMGVLRKTYLIDEEGKILKIIEKVKTKEHTQQIYKELNLNE